MTLQETKRFISTCIQIDKTPIHPYCILEDNIKKKYVDLCYSTVYHTNNKDVFGVNLTLIYMHRQTLSRLHFVVRLYTAVKQLIGGVTPEFGRFWYTLNYEKRWWVRVYFKFLPYNDSLYLNWINYAKIIPDFGW